MTLHFWGLALYACGVFYTVGFIMGARYGHLSAGWRVRRLSSTLPEATIRALIWPLFWAWWFSRPNGDEA